MGLAYSANLFGMAGNYLEDKMKKLALAVALTAAGTSAMAGSYAKDDVVMEPVVVVEETAQASSSAGILVPLILLALVAAAISAD